MSDIRPLRSIIYAVRLASASTANGTTGGPVRGCQRVRARALDTVFPGASLAVVRLRDKAAPRSLSNRCVRSSWCPPASTSGAMHRVRAGWGFPRVPKTKAWCRHPLRSRRTECRPQSNQTRRRQVLTLIRRPELCILTILHEPPTRLSALVATPCISTGFPALGSIL